MRLRCFRVFLRFLGFLLGFPPFPDSILSVLGLRSDGFIGGNNGGFGNIIDEDSGEEGVECTFELLNLLLIDGKPSISVVIYINIIHFNCTKYFERI